MTKQEIKDFRHKVSKYIDRRRLHDAIVEIKDMAHKRMAWEIEDKIKTVEQNYAYMLKYLTQGATDPERNDVYDNIIDDIYTQLDSLISYIETSDSPTLYYSNLRYQKMYPAPGRLSAMIERYKLLADKLSLFSLVTSSSDNDVNRERAELEKIQSDIFIHIWTAPQLSSEQYTEISSLLESEQIRWEMKQHVVSALTLGLLQQYDRRRLQLLLSVYINSTNIRVSSAALVGFVIGLWKYSSRPLGRKLNDMLMAAKDSKNWQSDLRITFIELIRARDTERINRKMRDEVIPRMEKLRPDMINKINKAQLESDDAMSLNENPEWQELLEKSGIADQLKELTEIQLEGGDVMMSTFAHLKNYPFFQNISNWFLPFDPMHSSVADTIGTLDIIGDMMENARLLCDNDKYSFMFAIKSVPEKQKEMMISQMKSQSANIYEMMGSMNSDQGPEGRRIAVNSYMQNIYRFFKLFYRKDEFFDPFGQSLNLITVPSLSTDFNDTEMLQVVAEFYFKLKYMREALDVFLHLDKLTPGDASRYQKIGYCYERLSDYAEAIKYYERADLLDKDSAWTIRRLASNYRTIGDKAASLRFYQRLVTVRPDDMDAAILYGQSLLENGDYDEALHEFYRVEFLDENPSRVWRLLAWTLFLVKDFETAEKYYGKIIADGATANDYLNLGHVHTATGDIGRAVSDYVEAIRHHDGNKEWFVKSINDDIKSMVKAGVDPTIVPMIADAVIYSI